MRKLLCFVCVVIGCAAHGQGPAPRLEASASTGLFFESLNYDSLVPQSRRGGARLGDVSSLALQVALPLGNTRWAVKAGLGYSLRHYSINKYSAFDFFTDLFLFDAPQPADTVSLSYIRFTNKYLQVPVSISYRAVGRAASTFTLDAGLNTRTDLLLGSTAQAEFGSSYAQPSPATATAVKKLYTQYATNVVFTAEPYLQASVFFSRRLGIYLQSRPFSFYAAPLSTKFTSGSFELFGGTFGVVYRLERK